MQAVALFDMIRRPLAIIPFWAALAFQAKVALDRIETYLGEDEVTSQVSSLKPSQEEDFISPRTYDEFGLRNASFQWNSVKEEEKKEKDNKDEHVRRVL